MLHGTIIGSACYILALSASVICIYRYRKSCEPLNGFVWLILSFLAAICMGSIAAGILSPLHVPVNIYSMAAVYAFIAAFMAFLIRREGMRQEYVWEKFDFFMLALITVAIIAISVKMFTPQLRYTYYNSDAGLHLKEATDIVRAQSVTKMYFLHLQNAMIIELLQPFVRIADWYKGYILGDCFFLWIETLFFAAFIRRYAKTNASKAFAAILTAGYFLGYPFFSFHSSFGYWAVGSMFVGFLVMSLQYYEEAKVARNISAVMLMLGCFGVMTSYMMFAPVAFFTVLFYLIVVARREGKVFARKNVLLALQVFLLPTVMGGCYCLYGFFISSGTSISGALSNQGGIYTELYADFFWTIFPALYVLARTFRKRRLTAETVFFAAFFGFTCIMLLLTLTHHVSTYYYYKTYYPLWMLCWALTAQAVSVMLQEAKDVLVAYCMMVLSFAALCFGKIEYKIVTSTENITGGMHSTAFFTLYQQNLGAIFNEEDNRGLPDSVFDLFQYVQDHLSEEKMVPLLTEMFDYGHTYLYEGSSAYDFPDFYEWRHTPEELRQAFYDWDVHYAVMMKDTQFEREHGKETLASDAVAIEFENEAGYVLKLAL